MRSGCEEMTKRVLALGLDPAFADLEEMPGLTLEMIKSHIDAQLERLRGLGYEVESCLVDPSETAELVVSRHLRSRRVDCVMFGAGLRAPSQLLLFERLINLVHVQAPGATLCFNTSPADSAEAVRRWIGPKRDLPAPFQSQRLRRRYDFMSRKLLRPSVDNPR